MPLHSLYPRRGCSRAVGSCSRWWSGSGGLRARRCRLGGLWRRKLLFALLRGLVCLYICVSICLWWWWWGRENIPSSSSASTLPKPSTARWLVKIRPPYFRAWCLSLSWDWGGRRAPEVKSARMERSLSVWKLCERTGMKVGL